MSNKRVLEVACFRPESAFVAEQAGADRVELCDDQTVGGVTPARDGLARVRHLLTIDLFVMIRPRGVDFVYNEEEFEQMKKDVEYCKSIGCEGVVFGILLPETNCVDSLRCKELVELARPMQCTFHRAIDDTPDLTEAVETLIACGFSRILTSGGKSNALEGLAALKHMADVAAGRIDIMPGGGVRASNIAAIMEQTTVKEYHSSALDTQTQLPDEQEIRTMKRLLAK